MLPSLVERFKRGTIWFGDLDKAATAIERLTTRNAALVEALEASRCPVDMRSLVKDCQQCGCCNGLFIRDVLKEQK